MWQMPMNNRDNRWALLLGYCLLNFEWQHETVMHRAPTTFQKCFDPMPIPANGTDLEKG